MLVLYRTFPLVKIAEVIKGAKVPTSRRNVSVLASQRLDLGLVLDPKLEGLGLISVSAKCGKVSVSPRTENHTFRSQTPRSRLHPSLIGMSGALLFILGYPMAPYKLSYYYYYYYY